MADTGFKDFYDVIVIGAGVGGLTAAALLSRAGLSVCVLEKEPHVGGYLAGFRRKNFVFDTAIHWLNQCGPDGILDKLFKAIGTDHPQATEQQRIRRYKGNQFDYLLTNNPDEMRDQLIQDFPAERKGYRKVYFIRPNKSVIPLNIIIQFSDQKRQWDFSRSLKIKSGCWSLLFRLFPFFLLVVKRV